MAPAGFTQEEKEIINANPVAKIVDDFRDSLPTGVAFDQYISSPEDDEIIRLGSVKDVHEAWERPYSGKTVDAFINTINAIERTFQIKKDYAKFIPIVQSSGVGKSRLIDQFSKRVPGISFTLRTPGQTGYPPGDPEITDYLLTNRDRSPKERLYYNMAVVVALFAASIQESPYTPA
jgi:hypothetical protein